MLAAFKGPRPFERAECCHNNGIPDDDRIDNLRWDTRSANAIDAHRHGQTRLAPRRGALGNGAKLTDAEAMMIAAHIGFLPYVHLADLFGVSKYAVAMLAAGKTWKHIRRNYTHVPFSSSSAIKSRREHGVSHGAR